MTINEQVIAKIAGEDYTSIPDDLYIPPDALEIILETFEGPLDLLLYLIKKQNLDILSVSVAKVTKQYMEYIELMQCLRLELAAEYLLMAAMLTEIKSRMLLPRQQVSEEEEDDPRAELIRRLQEYEQFKKAAENLDTLPRVERDIFPVEAKPTSDLAVNKPLATVTFEELMLAFKGVLVRADNNQHHHIQRESLSIRQRMSEVLTRLGHERFISFTALFAYKEGRNGLVVTFIAILELVRQSMVSLVQTEPFSPIHLTLMGETCHE